MLNNEPYATVALGKAFPQNGRKWQDSASLEDIAWLLTADGYVKMSVTA